MKWKIAGFIGGLVLLVLILFGSLGGASFLERILQDKLFCKLIKSCNPVTSIFTNRQLTNYDGSTPNKGIYLTHAVFLGRWGETIFVWSPYWFIRGFRIDQDASFGVSLIYDPNNPNRKKIDKFISTAELKSISIELLGRVEDSELDRDAGGDKLAFGEFKDFDHFVSLVEPGYYLKIIYNPSGFLAQDIIIMDI